ncbi:hypothetical protein ES703_42183 [subsurface metagenome]
MQYRLQVLDSQAIYSFFPGDQSLVNHVNDYLDRCLAASLGIPGLQNIELPRLNCELNVLHVTIVAFQEVDFFLQLGIDIRHQPLKVGDRSRCPGS